MDAAWRTYLHVETWDLAAAGVEAVLDLAAGELGVDGIRVSAVSGAVCRLSARPEIMPRTFRCEAAAHFQPDARRYADTRLRPPTAAWIKSRNPLVTLAEACAKRSLKLRLRVSACDQATLLERHSHAACRDAFGDSSPARMCPTHPDVRTYLRGVIDDLSRHYGPAAIDLAEADFGPAERFHPGRPRPAEPLDGDSLALCFCEACRKAAEENGIDAAGLAEHVVAAFDAGGAPERERIAAYQRFRAGMVSELLRELRCPPETELWWESVDGDPQRGFPAAALYECAAGQIVRFDRPAAVHAAMERIGVCYPVGVDRAVEEGAPAVVREMSELTTRGHRLFILDEFATMPKSREEWVRQAIRFARRQGGG